GSSIDIAVLSKVGVGLGVGTAGRTDGLGTEECTAADCGVHATSETVSETSETVSETTIAQSTTPRFRGWAMVTIVVATQLAIVIAGGVTLHSTQIFSRRRIVFRGGPFHLNPQNEDPCHAPNPQHRQKPSTTLAGS
ncbi:MAG: hypothetical protein JWN09_2140, partial [Microbacteriaceae bacterium]|nr:hypothetical protein [Microbacteriaceae bacterium]